MTWVQVIEGDSTKMLLLSMLTRLRHQKQIARRDFLHSNLTTPLTRIIPMCTYIYNYSRSPITATSITGILVLPGSCFYGHYFNYCDFCGKKFNYQVKKCSVVNLKFTILWFSEIFGHNHPGNRGPTVDTYLHSLTWHWLLHKELFYLDTHSS